jgi:serine/threonine protein kinase
VTRDEYARLKEIVAGALAQPATGRPAYVIARCGPDVTLRIEVESLVTAALHAAPMYEEPTLLVGGSRVTLGALEAVDDEFQGTERYSVRRRIGAGGMGIVYEVDDRVRGQVVALKTLRRRNADDVYRLKREFRHLADVAHPNLVSLYDLVIDDQLCFFTMELVDGTTFVDDARREPSGAGVADRVLRTLPQLIEGVQALHRRGLQHRDIKPSNVLVTHAGRVVVLDFGLTSGLLRDDLSGGELAGTPAYLSPEQCRGVDMTDAGDWYGVGATLYHALAGRVPFDGPVRELIARKATEDPLPVSATG